MKKKDEELVTLRLSGRSKLSKKTAEIYEKSGNKSALLGDALEFYLSFGQSINEQLKELNSKMDGLESLKGGVYQAVPVKREDISIDGKSEEIKGIEVQTKESSIEVESEEERIEKESIQSTLGSFMNFEKGG
jgi:hypothetical protein